MIEPWGIECVSKCLPWKELPWLHAQTIQLLIKINFLIDWDDLNFAAAFYHSEMD